MLPLLVVEHDDRRTFITERWRIKREHLFLVPEESPIGLRLPLAQVDFIDFPNVEPRDPMTDTRLFPDVCVGERASYGGGNIANLPVRTAVAIESRPGHVSVFLPPLADAEDYAALLAAIEAAARKTAVYVSLEGYLPPYDPRLRVIKVTPDPGVSKSKSILAAPGTRS